MPVSERLRSRWGPSRLAHHGDLRSSKRSKPQELHRLPFEWKNKSLLWYPFRCVEWKVTSVTAAEFCGAVIPSDLHVPVNSAVVHSKNTRLEQFVFYLVMWKNSRVFMSHNSAEVHWTFHFKILYWKFKDSVLETLKLQAKAKTIVERELWWFDTFESFSLVQPIRLFEPF